MPDKSNAARSDEPAYASAPVAGIAAAAIALASLMLSFYCLNKRYDAQTYLVLSSEAFPALSLLIALGARSIQRDRWSRAAVYLSLVALILALRQVVMLFAAALGGAAGHSH